MNTMKKTTIFLILLLSNGVNLCFAQDTHFSQFSGSPLTINPAFTGGFSGDQRIIMNYRNQWNSIGKAYKTFSSSIDFSVLKGKIGRDYSGAGLLLITDKAGRSELSTIQIGIPLAYHHALNEDAYIAVGLLPSFIKRSIDYTNLKFEDQYDIYTNYVSATTKEQFSNENSNFIDLSAGILWYYDAYKKDLNLYAGTALFHILKPKQTFLAENEGLYRKLVFNGGGQYGINEMFSIIPSMIIFIQGRNFTTSLGSFIRYEVKTAAPQNIGLYFGTWYRFGDAMLVVTKIDYENFSLGFSYDINVSGLHVASKLKGGPEISLIASFPFTKAKRHVPIPCPRLD